jgi:SAM-dependent methyltransferase
MASDLRVVAAPLSKAACAACGLVARMTALPEALFTSGYALYAHAPGEPRETARQEQYAEWIVREADLTPRSVFDVGCGNGSLLLALGRRWPAAALMGCEPSVEAVAHGRAAGLDVWPGTLDQTRELRADLVVTVNVLEHTSDPVRFLAGLRHRLTADGRVVVVCPDATAPDVEMLMADHQVSLTPAHLRALLARVGLHTLWQSTAPPALGRFQMAVADLSGTIDSAPPAVHDSAPTRAYLQRWAALDGELLARIGHRQAVCFGIGEAAGLVRAYAPATWARVAACTADDIPTESSFGDRPIVPLNSVDTAEPLLVAVRPADQRDVAARLAATRPCVVTWYDLI